MDGFRMSTVMLPGKDNCNFIAFEIANRALAEKIKRKLILMSAKAK